MTKDTHKTGMQTHTHCPAPPHPQSAIAKPHVSVGINRSAQSSSHPALKSFPEVVLQKPAAEEDKRTAIPQAQHLLSSTQLSLCCPLLSLHYSLIPSFLPSLIISMPLLFLSISCFLSIPSFSPALYILWLYFPAPVPFYIQSFFQSLPSSCNFFSTSSLRGINILVLTHRCVAKLHLRLIQMHKTPSDFAGWLAMPSL